MKNLIKCNKFISDARDIHGDVYDYSNVVYVNSKTKVEVNCGKHGVFFVTPEKHIHSKTKCPACAGRPIITTQTFINRAAAMHGTFYDYTHVKYVNDRTKVSIVCPLHGVFLQSPGHHVGKKQGCPKCKHALASLRGVGGYSATTINPQDTGQFYCVIMSNADESYIKVGITKTSITRRLSGSGHQIQTLRSVGGLLLDVYHLEQRILTALKDIRYRVKPTNVHAKRGWTECFRYNNLTRVLTTIDDHLASSALPRVSLNPLFDCRLSIID